MAHRLDLIQFQLSEISQANLQLNEDETLMEEKKQLSNFERIHEAVQASYDAFRANKRDLIGSGAMGHLEDINGMNAEYKELAESVSNSFYILEDAAKFLRNELDNLEFDPERLNVIEDRLNEINQLKRKYGHTLSADIRVWSKNRRRNINHTK